MVFVIQTLCKIKTTIGNLAWPWGYGEGEFYHVSPVFN